ncbi:hypothetical protein NPIL_699361 [Nephila pilipes]|uniref:Uncharacterized protein n=1 Tax=Nephila pilipes TaxID=299642 RepID=A0A8X6PQI9_NEPPI|nr:hypothetical protein NPIL_699361 [Nephila pilipes]
MPKTVLLFLHDILGNNRLHHDGYSCVVRDATVASSGACTVPFELIPNVSSIRSSQCMKRGLLRIRFQKQSNKWRQPGSPRPLKVHAELYQLKGIFTVSYDVGGVMLHPTVSRGQNVDVVYYYEFQRHHQRPIRW